MEQWKNEPGKIIESPRVTENTSDGFHTFKELYEFRLLLNAALFNDWHFSGYPLVVKSKHHSDGTIPFNDPNWFIVVAETPNGQISFHYEMKHWDLFIIPEVDLPPEYDGHTAQDVLIRLKEFIDDDNKEMEHLNAKYREL